jgi:hypothetical protein
VAKRLPQRCFIVSIWFNEFDFCVQSLLDPQRANGINIMLTQFGKRSMFDVAKVRMFHFFVAFVV